MISFPPFVLTPRWVNSVCLKGVRLTRLWAQSLYLLRSRAGCNMTPSKKLQSSVISDSPRAAGTAWGPHPVDRLCLPSEGPCLKCIWPTCCQGKVYARVISKMQTPSKALLGWSDGLLMVLFLYPVFPIYWTVGLKTWRGCMEHVRGRIFHRWCCALLPMAYQGPRMSGYLPGSDAKFNQWFPGLRSRPCKVMFSPMHLAGILWGNTMALDEYSIP